MSAKKSVFRALLISLIFISSLLSPKINVLALSPETKVDTALAPLQFTAGGHVLGFTSKTMYAATGSHALQVNFLGAQHTQPQADSSTSAETAPLKRVSYPGLWNGIDLVYTATGSGIYTTTYTLAPGADASKIRLRYNSPLTLNQDGTLQLAFATGTLTESAPIAWQEIAGKHTKVDVAFAVHGQEVGFTLGAYNSHYPLTIDPTLAWNTFLGGNNADIGSSIAVDASGQNIFVTGQSNTTWGSPVRSSSGVDAFVAKLNASTGAIIWNTFLGGTGSDLGNGITVDGSGNVFVTGQSAATWANPVRAYTASVDAFVAKLNGTTGSLIWNTFLGGTANDNGNVIAINGGGNIFVTGFSNGTWGTPVRAFTPTGNDVFVVKLDSAGGLVWNTFLGADGSDSGRGIVAVTRLTRSGVYVSGTSPTSWSCQPTACTTRAYSGSFDAFVAKLNVSTGALIWNTFLGSSGSDEGAAIAYDDTNDLIYLTGNSSESWGSPIRAYTTSNRDAYVARIDATGNLIWNTFLGGSGQDIGMGIAVENSGNIFVTGNSTTSWGSPIRPYTASAEDAFLAKLNPAGGLAMNSFLGGNGGDEGNAIAVDNHGGAYVTGKSTTTWGNPVRAFTDASGNSDAFVAKISPPVVVSSTLVNSNPTNRANVNFTVTFSEPVTEVDTADFSLTTTGVTGAAISDLTGSGTTYNVKVSTGSGNGTIRLDLIDNDTIVDEISTPLGGTGLVNGDFTAGETYTVNKTLTFTSTAAQDGWVLESTETSNAGGTINSTDTTFRLGDDTTKKQYRGVLSFNTASIPDTAVISAVTLKVKKHSVTGGGDPLAAFQGFMVDVKTGILSSVDALQIADFQAAISKTIGPASPALTGGVYSINLINAKDFINVLSTNSGLTQIRLRFKVDDDNNATANFLSLFSGNATNSADRPQLVITYQVP